ncbi:MAG: EpsI family protein [Deltaproteobacteria bacterium]|nr:EpsI family protein [Deltaproteobacteria bacterium]
MKELTQIKPVSWIKFAIYGLLLLGIYHSAFTWLVTHDWKREAYSYCWLIPAVVFFLIWLKRDELASTPSEPSWAGLVPIGVGIVFFWLGELGGEYFTMYFSSWLMLVGICLLHLGWKKLKAIGFALFFILTMFPMPNFINTRIMLQLRLISSKLGVAIIQLFGLPATRQGNIIDLGFAKLQVVDACSGLHSLISLVVLSLLIVYFFKDHIWKRIVLLFSSMPLAIVTNSFRISMTAILYKYFGADVAEGFFHKFSGLLIFAICIPVLLIEMKILEKLPPVQSKTTSEPKEVEMKISGNNPGSHTRLCSGELPTSSRLRRDRSFGSPCLSSQHQDTGIQTKANKAISKHGFLLQPMFVVAVILLGVTLAISHTVDFREKIPVKKNLNQFPLKVGEWAADRRQPLAQKFIDALDLSEYVITNYQNRSGKKINFYVAYYESQRKGESIHSPATCLPCSGWSFDQSGTVKITGVCGNNGTMDVNRAVMQSGRNRQITYYWFPVRGRILYNAYQLKIYNFWDALTQQRTDGALVRLITKVYEDETLADAEERLQDFVRDIVPVLEEYIPGKDLQN